ncbi:long-chain-fatty-acid--CoA ligase 5-like [Lytechinus pictus]|uniref:long-chain-fatty-acid--CoA ligase 5-like n=1 Tax=Lytechinus pictus TaxID=7653 RepID=UPI0030B9B11D
METIVCDTLEKAERLRLEHSALRGLKTVIVMDLPIEGLGEQKAMFAAEGLQLMSFDDVVNCGTKNIVDRVLPKPETVCTLIYTSGTTGLPKGVPHTHKGLVATHAHAWQTASVDIVPNHNDTVISYLPLPHVYERTNLVMSNVNAANLPKRALFHHALKQKLKMIDRWVIMTDTIWDKLVFNKIRSLLGGRIQFVCSAAAPLSPDTAQFIRAAMSPNYLEAYGQTEAPLICHSLTHDHTSGHVGIPGGDVQIKLIDVPELDYYSKDDQGEVCVKGSHVFSGYYKDPELTSQVLQDGWVRTGDIGRWNKSGSLSIIDRKKDIFKLSQGVYIAPERIENVYLREPLVAQAFVTGDTTKNSLVGIMVPDQEELEKFAKKHKIPGCFEELCQNEKVKEVIFSRVMKHGKAEGLAGFEQVKGIHVHSEPFTEDAGLLTPTLKSKRNVMKQIFAEEIIEMYSEIDRGSK